MIFLFHNFLMISILPCKTERDMTGDTAKVKKDELHLKIDEKIDKYEATLFGIAYLRLENRQDAEDVVQETFYRYLLHLKSGRDFADEEHEKAWLLKVAVNRCRKYRRSAWVRHRAEEPLEEQLEHLSAHGAKEHSQKAAESGDGYLAAPEDEVLRKENGELVLSAVMALPVKYRDVIHLFYYEGMSVREMGALLGRKESTVTSQLTRGRELLRESLKEEFDFA